MTDTSRARCSRAGGVEQVLEQAQLVVAADERRLERLAPIAPATLGDDAHRAPRRDGRLLALEQPGRRPARTRSRCPRRAIVDSPTSTVPGGATRLEPRRGVDEVAGDHALVRGADRHRRLAGQHAGSRLDARAKARTASTSSSAARTARSASSSCAIGAPQTAITASPMNFSTVPP